MNPDQVFAFRKRINNPTFLISYLGNLSNEALKSVLALTEQKLSNETETIKQKVSLFITDCIEDIGKRTSGKNIKRRFFFLMEKRDERYFVACGGLFEKFSTSEPEKETHPTTVSGERTENELTQEKSFLTNLINLSAKAHEEVAYSVVQTAEGNTLLSFKTFAN